MTDQELNSGKLLKKNIFTVKDIEKFSGGDVEIFVDELTRIENKEAIFTDKYVQVFFCDEGLSDPSLFNEQTLEEAILGSHASYRNKIMVSLQLKFENSLY